MIENWKDVKDFEGLYKVSDLGRIKDHNELIILNFIEPNRKAEYKRIFLIKDNIKKSFAVHRLVLIAFVPNPENKPQGNHKNAIKNDNRLCNLEWLSQSENLLHAHAFYKNNPTLKPSYLRHLEHLKKTIHIPQVKKSILEDNSETYKYEIFYFNPKLNDIYHCCDC